MHRSVLGNKKYIKWSAKKSVEVITVAGLEAGLAEGGKKGSTYVGKDGKTYPVQWPSLTVNELKTLSSGDATKFKDKGFPTTHIVDPHTLESYESWSGGITAGTIMDASDTLAKKLRKEHGKGIARKKLVKFNASLASARGFAKAGDLTKALGAAGKIEADAAKLPKLLQDQASDLKKELLGQAAKILDEVDGLMARGDKKAAAKQLRTILRGLKGTDLEERANALLAATKE